MIKYIISGLSSNQNIIRSIILIMIKSPEYYLVFKDLLFFSIETERSNAKSFSKSKLTFAQFFCKERKS